MPFLLGKNGSIAIFNANVAYIRKKEGSKQKENTSIPVTESLFCMLLQIFKNKDNIINSQGSDSLHKTSSRNSQYHAIPKDQCKIQQ